MEEMNRRMACQILDTALLRDHGLRSLRPGLYASRRTGMIHYWGISAMSITIDLQDKLAQRLQRQAEARQMSLHEWVISVLSRAPEFPDQPEAWRELNARRFHLIHQRYQAGLTEAEEAELAELQATADKWLEPHDRERLEMLEPYEALARRLTHRSDE